MQKYKQLIFACLLAASSLQAWSQDNYQVLQISPALLENANAVVRMSQLEVIIKSEGRAVINEKKVVTILNQAGNDLSSMVLYYDKFRDVQSFSGKLMDANGKVIRTLKKSEIKDVSGTSSSELADDVRYKLHDFNYQIFPFTIEYETSVEL